MLIDDELVLAEGQTTTVGTDAGLLSEHVIDLQRAGQNIGTGNPPVYAVIEVITELDDATDDEPLHVDLQSDSADDHSAAPVVHQRLCTIPATSPAGTRFIATIQPGGTDMKRYLGVLFSTNADPLTAGAVSVFLTDSVDVFKAYPGARVVLGPDDL